MDKTMIGRKLPNKEERHRLFGSVIPGPKSKPTEKKDMSDLQNIKKDFLFELDAVGISNVKHPVQVNSMVNPTSQSTIGNFMFSSSIDRTSKGTNMSRFTEQLHLYHTENRLTTKLKDLKQFAIDLTKRLKQNDATVEVSFPWFYERSGPHSGLTGMNHADVAIVVTYDLQTGFKIDVTLSVLITTLCPCSKEISEYSAHNQRGHISMEASLDADFNDEDMDWKELLLEAAESNASARLHPVLKRPDEKVITEHAYENPRFVEDMARLVAADLYEMDFVNKFVVKCQNEESIHMHDAIASITFDKATEMK